jgi:hypothetical protein
MVQDDGGGGSGRGPFQGTITAFAAEASLVRTVGILTKFRTETLRAI